MLITVDPGRINGMSFWEGTKMIRTASVDFCGCMNEIKQVLYKFGEKTTVIYETFALYPWMASKQNFSKFPAVETIGGIKLLQMEYGFKMFEQQPSKAKVFTDEKARLIAGNIKPNNKHTRDAIKHGLLYWKKRGMIL